MQLTNEELSRLPDGVPSRDNAATDCIRRAIYPTGEYPDHLVPCTCEAHTGVCRECGYKITRGEFEYGHARARNRAPDEEDGVRRDCYNRPLAVNPTAKGADKEPQVWEGYDRERWNGMESNAKVEVADGD